MKDYLLKHPWKIIEQGFHSNYNQITESIMSLGNGMIGGRASFEETFSGESLSGNYIAGIYYPDKTRVGWWKNGYPEYFAKVLNAVNWYGINLSINGQKIDLQSNEVLEFYRELDLKHGVLTRKCTIGLKNGNKVQIQSERFCSMKNKECAWLKYSIIPLNFSGKIKIENKLDFDVHNQDSNYDEKFWVEQSKQVSNKFLAVTAQTKKTNFEVCAGMQYKLKINGKSTENLSPTLEERYNFVSQTIEIEALESDHIELTKWSAQISDFHHGKDTDLQKLCRDKMQELKEIGYAKAISQHKQVWLEIWENSDISIKGDIAAQQAIRFNIFHLYQTYSGDDLRLNIGPKGFTGEKYGGSTYWDTEAYCLPFYMSTASETVAKNLLLYRYYHLEKAIENAEKLGFSNGAALYPMVTINGEECHNEWEITFEEIHRNGAIAYAIFDYVNYTGDLQYLEKYGIDVLVAISRFWAQRVNWSEDKSKYVMLGVTGPNEYENNVNNNWYTSYIAKWCLDYTNKVLNSFSKDVQQQVSKKLSLDEKERQNWEEISSKLYFPYSEEYKIYLQQDGFLDKEIVSVNELDTKHLPINQNWSWDRILRSCYIKQADVLQGFYFFEDDFSLDEHKRNFDFYEPITVHESSLSPCIHSILASKLGYVEKAYEMYLRTARLDLDDYNNDTEDGLHITSMAGTWLALVKGYGGMRIKSGELHFKPTKPSKWSELSFKILFRGSLLKISIGNDEFRLTNLSNKDVRVFLNNQANEIKSNSHLSIKNSP